jgi:hypothetical protein
MATRVPFSMRVERWVVVAALAPAADDVAEEEPLDDDHDHCL